MSLKKSIRNGFIFYVIALLFSSEVLSNPNSTTIKEDLELNKICNNVSSSYIKNDCWNKLYGLKNAIKNQKEMVDEQDKYLRSAINRLNKNTKERGQLIIDNTSKLYDSCINKGVQYVRETKQRILEKLKEEDLEKNHKINLIFEKEIKICKGTYEKKEKLPHEDLVYGFCYSLMIDTAQDGCDKNYRIRVDTERKIENKIGFSPRGEDNKDYKKVCSEAFSYVIEYKEKACRTAWEKYGCNGSKVPKLLQINEYGPNGKDVLCEYN